MAIAQQLTANQVAEKISSTMLAAVYRGVNDVRVGRSFKMDRAGIEESFDLGAIVIFRDREALNKFERDPRRGAAIDAMLQPLVRRYIVYNLVNE